METELADNVVKTKTSMAPACYTLSKEETRQFFKCLETVKVTSGYCAYIQRNLDKQNSRLIGMKSHDCHVMITQILPVAIRGLMEPWVRKTVMDLCEFCDSIS